MILAAFFRGILHAARVIKRRRRPQGGRREIEDSLLCFVAHAVAGRGAAAFRPYPTYVSLRRLFHFYATRPHQFFHGARPRSHEPLGAARLLARTARPLGFWSPPVDAAGSAAAARRRSHPPCSQFRPRRGRRVRGATPCSRCEQVDGYVEYILPILRGSVGVNRKKCKESFCILEKCNEQCAFCEKQHTRKVPQISTPSTEGNPYMIKFGGASTLLCIGRCSSSELLNS